MVYTKLKSVVTRAVCGQVQLSNWFCLSVCQYANWQSSLNTEITWLLAVCNVQSRIESETAKHFHHTFPQNATLVLPETIAGGKMSHKVLPQ